VIDANEDGSTWVRNYDGTAYIFSMNSSDDYLVTPQIVIPEAGEYHLAFFSSGQMGPVLLRILYGTTLNPEDMEILKY